MTTLGLKGGVIIVGSLIWEDHLNYKKNGENYIRQHWRNQNLKLTRFITPVPIRYGRISPTREKTYSMIFTKGSEETLGQGLILEFKHSINSFEDLERQAIALAIAEGIYNNENKRISCKWGSVGLLINPSLKTTDFGKFEYLYKKWTNLYQNYGDDFIANDYQCDEDNEPPINQQGLLTIEWRQEMTIFDVLLATPVVPDPKKVLTPKQIATKMIEKKYDTYFKSNLAHNIKTSQDDQIFKFLSIK